LNWDRLQRQWAAGYSELSAFILHPFALTPTVELTYVGFRVACSLAVPEPNSIALLLAGGLCLLGFGWRRRKAG